MRRARRRARKSELRRHVNRTGLPSSFPNTRHAASPLRCWLRRRLQIGQSAILLSKPGDRKVCAVRASTTPPKRPFLRGFARFEPSPHAAGPPRLGRATRAGLHSPAADRRAYQIPSPGAISGELVGRDYQRANWCASAVRFPRRMATTGGRRWSPRGAVRAQAAAPVRPPCRIVRANRSMDFNRRAPSVGWSCEGTAAGSAAI